MSLILFQSLHFPAITICGMNALRLNLLNRLESLRREFDERSPLNSKFHIIMIHIIHIVFHYMTHYMTQ